MTELHTEAKNVQLNPQTPFEYGKSQRGVGMGA